MNAVVSKKLRNISLSLPDVYVVTKINRVVFGKELLKTKTDLKGEVIEPGKKYNVTSSIATEVNHYERLKRIYSRCKKNGYEAEKIEKQIAKYISHSRAIGKKQAKQKSEGVFKHKIKQSVFNRIVNFFKKLFSK